MSKQVLFIHGWMNLRPAGAWQRLVGAELRKQGHQVYFPQLPTPAEPTFESWSQVVLGELEQIRDANTGQEVVVIGHSMGALTWLKLAAEGLVSTPVDRALLVAPAYPEFLPDFPDFNVKLDAIGGTLASAAASTLLVGSDADQWQPNGIVADFGKPLGLDSVVVEGAKHFSLDDGFGPWQGLVNWVNDSASDLSVR